MNPWDGLTLDEKRDLLADLKRAYYSGVRSVRHGDHSLEYASSVEMGMAIQRLQRQIAVESGQATRPLGSTMSFGLE